MVYRAGRAVQLGVVVGAMCTHRFVVPASLDGRAEDSAAEATQVLEEDVLCVVPAEHAGDPTAVQHALQTARQLVLSQTDTASYWSH